MRSKKKVCALACQRTLKHTTSNHTHTISENEWVKTKVNRVCVCVCAWIVWQDKLLQKLNANNGTQKSRQKMCIAHLSHSLHSLPLSLLYLQLALFLYVNPQPLYFYYKIYVVVFSYRVHYHKMFASRIHLNQMIHGWSWQRCMHVLSQSIQIFYWAPPKLKKTDYSWRNYFVAGRNSILYLSVCGRFSQRCASIAKIMMETGNGAFSCSLHCSECCEWIGKLMVCCFAPLWSTQTCTYKLKKINAITRPTQNWTILIQIHMYNVQYTYM